MNVDERNAIVEANLGLAHYFAARYTADRMEQEDLVQEARMGLMDAVERFDPDRGVSLSTYARFYVRKYIMEAIQKKNDPIRTPRRQPGLPCQSLDAESRHGTTIGEEIADDRPSVEDAFEHEQRQRAVRDCIKRLSHRDAMIIRCRHGVNVDKMTLAQVGRILDVTPERVRQLQRAAEQKLRDLVADCATLKEHGA